MIDKLTIDQAVDIAIRNTYLLYMGMDTYENIINSDYPIFIHDINNNITDEDIEFMIAYFETTEEYEKCLDLKKRMNEI